MLPVAYIPSRGRSHNVRKLIKAWESQYFDVVFMVEPEEAKKYVAAAMVGDHLCKVAVVELPASNQGIGYSRQQCLLHAERTAQDAIILADDDIKPVSGMYNLIEAAEDPYVLGVSGRYSYMDFSLGPKIKDQSQLILLPTGMWRLVALNVENVLGIGNYDPEMTCAEDGDLMLRGLEAGFPWMVHLGSKCGSIGARYEAGGLRDYCDAVGAENILQVNHQRFHEKHPNWVSAPPAKYRVAWRKAYQHYLPEWKKYSFLHGGDINIYLGVSGDEG